MRIRKTTHPTRYISSAAGSSSTSETFEGAIPEITPAETAQPESVNPFEAMEAWHNSDDTAEFIRVRWSSQALPLNVAIQSDDHDSGMARFIFSVIREWEAASGGLIRFVQVPWEDAETASIVLSWTDETTHGRDYEVGHTQRKVSSQNLITRVAITLLKNPAIDAELNPSEQLNRLRATILHEFGHALGLEHSNNDREVMHHRGWKNPFLAPGDIQALKDLYRELYREL